MTVIERNAGLDRTAMAAVVALRRRCEEHDGSDLKLELSTAPGVTEVDSLLARRGGELIGFCSIDAGHDVEVCGMVDPAARRGGAGAALLDAASEVNRARGGESVLVIAEDAFPAAIDWLTRRGGHLDSSEHRMVASLDEVDTTGPRATLRRATRDNEATLRRLVAAGFPPEDEAHAAYHEAHADELWSRDEALLAYDGDMLIGTARITATERPMVYGFIVEPDLRGRGMGRLMLRALLALLRERRVETVGLEVVPENERAVRLYTSFGFRVVTTYRYMRLRT